MLETQDGSKILETVFSDIRRRLLLPGTSILVTFSSFFLLLQPYPIFN